MSGPSVPTTPATYLIFDGMTWPNPLAVEDLAWRLTYGEPTRSDILAAASFMSSYAHLIELPSRERSARVAQIRAAMVEANHG